MSKTIEEAVCDAERHFQVLRAVVTRFPKASYALMPDGTTGLVVDAMAPEDVEGLEVFVGPAPHLSSRAPAAFVARYAVVQLMPGVSVRVYARGRAALCWPDVGRVLQRLKREGALERVMQAAEQEGA